MGQYSTVQYSKVKYSTVQYCTVLYCTVLYCTVLYCTVLYYTVLYCTVLYCTVLYCTVPCCTALYVLHEGVCTAWSGELLPSLVYPEVGDPLGAGEDGAGRVPGHVVTLPVAVEVVPEGRGAALGPQR